MSKTMSKEERKKKKFKNDKLRPKFDNNRIDEIRGSFDSRNYYEIGNLVQKYTKDYPNDIAGYLFYVKYLEELGLFNQAEKVLDYVTELDDFFKDRTYHFYLILLSNNLLYQERYGEALLLLKRYENIFKTHDIKYDDKVQFAAIKSGYTDFVDLSSNLYSRLYDYSKDVTIAHILRRHINKSLNSTFVEGFPLIDAYNYIRDNLKYSTYSYQDGIYNMYFFYAPGCGYSYEERVDYIKVVSLKDSNKIITMYPIKQGTSIMANEFPVEYGHFSNKKVKRLSQVDKFNKKYGIKED